MQWIKIRIYLVRNILLVASLILLGASWFFYSGAESVRAKLTEADSSQFQTGSIVTLVKAIDGDEVAVTNASGKSGVVRLAGIKSFLSSDRDQGLGRMGRSSFDYLNSFQKKKFKLTLNSGESVDSRGRLLGFLELLPEGGEASIDIGKQMINEGWSVVYTEFASDRETKYMAVQQRAESAQKGLWANSTLAGQVNAFNILWLDARAEREKD